ncbi:MAG TPA: PilZ domain-containing protein [Polyangia bacterium]|nr:PilZ domain-containing protein [Polyangia bacterium]
MITVLTSNNSAVFRQLGSRAFQRLGVQHRVATSGREALDLVQRERPALAILDAQLPDLDGYEVCRRIKSDPELAAVRVMLVLGSMLTREQLDQLGASGCDDVFCVPAPSDELYQHAARLIGLPYRGSRRIHVQLRIELEAGPRVIEGRLHNLSRDGAKISLKQRVGTATDVRLRMSRSEAERAAAVKGRIVWEQESEEGEGSTIGVQFVDLLPETRRLIADLALWEVNPGDDDTLVVTLQGDFTEVTDFSQLSLNLAGRVEFDLSSVRYMNSSGVRNWIAFLRGLTHCSEYVFVRASIGFIAQAAMVPGVLGKGRVESFFTPYHCDRCDRSEERLLQTSAISQEAQLMPPRFRCGVCGGELTFDDIPERYFAFLARTA